MYVVEMAISDVNMNSFLKSIILDGDESNVLEVIIPDATTRFGDNQLRGNQLTDPCIGLSLIQGDQKPYISSKYS